MVFLHYLSLAWIADRLFGKAYYSLHFELVLNDLLDREQKTAWVTLMEDHVYGAINSYAWDGIFAENIDKEISFGGGGDAGHRG